MKNIRFLAWLCALLMLCAADASAASAPTAFTEANAFYKSGAYDRALERYASVSDSGLESAALFFNIGNCYFKKSAWGRAILNYERAGRLDPRDPDIAFNKKLALEKVAPPGLKPSGSFIRRSARFLFQRISINEAIAGLIACYALGIILVAVGTLFPHKMRSARRWAGGGLLLIFIYGSLVLCDRIGALGREAVILSGATQAKFEPSAEATTYFELSEGMNVTVLDNQEGWVKIRRADGKTGWIRRDTQETI